MENQGWIKLHRKFIFWEWYDDLNTSRLFLHCLLKANHRQKKWRGLLINKGQFVTSLSKLSKETGLSLQQVRTSIKKLQSTHDLTYKPSSKYTVITVDNYNKYQGSQGDDNTVNNIKKTNKQHSSNKQVTTNNNDKNDKEYIGNQKNLEKRQQKFKEDIFVFSNKYPKEMLFDFYNYWSEPNKSKTKFLSELQRTFDLSRRLARWSKNDFNRNKQTNFVDESQIELQKKKAKRQRLIYEEKINNAASDDEKRNILKKVNFSWD